MVSECALDEPDDEAICRYLARLQVQSFVSVPNLVDHIGAASLVGNGYLGDRPSACFIPNPPSPNPRIVQSAFFPQVTYLPQSWRSARPVHPASNPFAAAYDWQLLPAAHIVRMRQLSRRDLLDAMVGTIESVMPARPMKADFGHSRLYDLWLVSYTLGFALADKGENVRIGTLVTALSRPPATHALSTLPGGILREFVGCLELDRFRPLFDFLVRRGVTYGFTGIPPEAEGRLK
jgi:hypothetical protein